MSDRWSNSDRRKRLPNNWNSLRKKVLDRDEHQCVFEVREGGQRFRCPERATEVDHIVAGDNHEMNNLQSLCSFHHDKKTRKESWAAKAKKRKEISKRFRRPQERHPGLL